MKEQYYWFDNFDWTVNGCYDTEQEAREAAETESENNEDSGHKRDYYILKAVSRSPAPTLKRKWKSA